MQRLTIGALATLLISLGSSGTADARGSDPAMSSRNISSRATNVNVSRMLGNQAETAVAINPTNPDNLVVTSNLENFSGLFEAYSLDGGASWDTQIIATGGELGAACCDSSLAFDQYGAIVDMQKGLTEAVTPFLEQKGWDGDLPY